MADREAAFQRFMEEVWYSPFIGTFENETIVPIEVFDAFTNADTFEEMLDTLNYTEDEIEVNEVWQAKADDFDAAKSRYSFE